MKVVLCTGGFDPLHSGHIAFFREASKLGDELIIGLNSDSWLTRKKGAPFMPWHERYVILQELWMVTDVIAFNDSNGTAIDAIHIVQAQWPEHEIVFANGGDRFAENIPEFKLCNDLNIEMVFNVGRGGKIRSSSDMLKEYSKKLKDK